MMAEMAPPPTGIRDLAAQPAQGELDIPPLPLHSAGLVLPPFVHPNCQDIHTRVVTPFVLGADNRVWVVDTTPYRDEDPGERIAGDTRVFLGQCYIDAAEELAIDQVSYPATFTVGALWLEPPLTSQNDPKQLTVVAHRRIYVSEIGSSKRRTATLRKIPVASGETQRYAYGIKADKPREYYMRLVARRSVRDMSKTFPRNVAPKTFDQSAMLKALVLYYRAMRIPQATAPDTSPESF